jgi:hypothetical protein
MRKKSQKPENNYQKLPISQDNKGDQEITLPRDLKSPFHIDRVDDKLDLVW